jgi:hypothetical protein
MVPEYASVEIMEVGDDRTGEFRVMKGRKARSGEQFHFVCDCLFGEHSESLSSVQT